MKKLRIAWLLAKLTYRWWSGRPMDGQRKTNATFRRPATRSLDPSGRALRWEMLAGYQRLLWRLGVSYLLSVSLLVALLSLSPWGATESLARGIVGWHLSLAGIGWAAWWTWRQTLLRGYRLPIPARRESLDESTDTLTRSWGIRWMESEGRLSWDREKTLPVATALQGMLQASWTDREKRTHVTIPRDYREPGGSPVEILLPASFLSADVAGIQARLVKTVSERLGIADPVAAWQLEGSVPRVLVRTQPAPPPLILFSEVRHFFEAASPFNPFYGVIAGGEGLHISVRDDSPHGAISAGSGAGKSEMIKVLIMQYLHWGWSVIVLDWKEESQEWAKGLPGVRYYSSEEKIHDALIVVGEEIQWRKENPGEPRNPVVVVCEEWSMTADLLSEYWSILRSTSEPEERKTLPVRSPALTSAKKLTYCGRSLGMFQMLVAIRFSARVTGGNADLRESFQVILMARYKSATVQMLAKGIKPFPKNKPKEMGRWVAVMGEDAVVFRAPLVSSDEAREWSLAGEECPASPWGSRGNRGRLHATQGISPTSEVAGGSSVIEATVVKSLSEMVDELRDVDENITLKILQLAAGNPESGFPDMQGIGARGAYLYDPQSVRIWTSRRYAQRMVGK